MQGGAGMAYVEGRVVHDADAHTMEPPEWLDGFASADVREYALDHFSIQENDKVFADIDSARARQADPEFRASAGDEVMLRKNYLAAGAWDPADRSDALDALGFASQLVFPTMPNTLIEQMEHEAEPALTYAAAAAANRAQIAFCASDPRLLPVCSVPLQDIERAGPHARQAIEDGAAALLIPNRMPRHHAHSHIGFDPVWAAAQEAGIPVVMHVATPDLVMPPQHRNNGLPPEPDFHGGGENFRSVSYMAISAAPLQALSMLIFDGVLERFPELKIGVIELGAVWAPGFMRQLEAAFDAFERHEQRLASSACAPRTTCGGRCGSRPTPPSRPAGSWRTRGRISACSAPTIPTWKAAATRCAASTARWRTCPPTSRSASSG